MILEGNAQDANPISLVSEGEHYVEGGINCRSSLLVVHETRHFVGVLQQQEPLIRSIVFRSTRRLR